MPITAQAEKKLRHDRKITLKNKAVRSNLRMLLKDARTSKSKKAVSLAFQALDKAIKSHVVHANKAARLKSRLARLVAAK